MGEEITLHTSRWLQLLPSRWPCRCENIWITRRALCMFTHDWSCFLALLISLFLFSCTNSLSWKVSWSGYSHRQATSHIHDAQLAERTLTIASCAGHTTRSTDPHRRSSPDWPCRSCNSALVIHHDVIREWFTLHKTKHLEPQKSFHWPFQSLCRRLQCGGCNAKTIHLVFRPQQEHGHTCPPSSFTLVSPMLLSGRWVGWGGWCPSVSFRWL